MGERVEVSTYRVLSLPTGSRRPRIEWRRWGVGRTLALSLRRDLLFSQILGLLLGRCQFFGSLFPFGIAFYAALLATDQKRRALALAGGMLVGLLTLKLPGELLIHLAMFITLLFLAKGQRPLSFLKVLGVVALLRGIPVVVGWSSNPSALGLEALLAGLLFVVLKPAAGLGKTQGIQYLSTQQIGATTMLVAGLVAGLQGLTIGPFSLSYIGGLLAVLVAAYVGDGMIGAAVGVLVGTVLVISGLGGPHLLGLLALGGLLAGLGAKGGKPGVSLGFVIGVFILSAQILDEYLFFSSLRHGGMAIFCLALLPTGLLDRASQLIPGTRQQLERQTRQEERLQQALNQRLADLSHMFTELAEKFLQGVPQQEQNHIDYLLERISEKVCRRCSSSSRCWGAGCLGTYWDILALVEGMERGEGTRLPGRLASYCSRIQELKMTIIDCLEAIRLNEYWQKRIRENQDLVAGQLQGVSDIIASLAAEVDLELKYAYDIEEKLERELQKLRLSIGELMAKRLPGGHLEIAIRKNPCRGQEQCRQQILPLINRQLGQSYALHRRQCAGRGECRQCQLQFLPAPKYSLTKEVRQVVQQGKTISGDRFGRVDLGDGKVAIIISDGMGSGPAAAMESTATVSMLEKMLTAGFDERYAVKLVNSLLLVRSPQETFATIDLALFDLYAGQVEFIKVGAPPSFLCRGETIEIIPATTPPAGILRELDIHVVKMELRPHDLILMCTDGIFSAGIPEEKGLGRLLLSLANTDDLHQVGESILNQMGSPGDNPWSDDATVALLRIEPNYHGHSFAIAPYELAS